MVRREWPPYGFEGGDLDKCCKRTETTRRCQYHDYPLYSSLERCKRYQAISMFEYTKESKYIYFLHQRKIENKFNNIYIYTIIIFRTRYITQTIENLFYSRIN